MRAEERREMRAEKGTEMRAKERGEQKEMSSTMNGRSTNCVCGKYSAILSLADAVVAHVLLIIGVGSLVNPQGHARLDCWRKKDMAHLSKPITVD